MRWSTKVERGEKVRQNSIFMLLILIGVSCSACRKKVVRAANDATSQAYATEPDWNNPDKLIPLGYQAAEGQRVFYQYCVWCHADSTPAGPSNRANVTPSPSLMNDGVKLNGLSGEFLRNIITLGGSAMGKSPMMPAWGKTLSQEEIQAVIAFTRAIAQPPYKRADAPIPGQATARLDDLVTGILRTRHDSRDTEEACRSWIRCFVLVHNGTHPHELVERDLNRLLAHLAVGENVAVSTQNEALMSSAD